MLIFALALAAPTPLTQTHQRDIACVVELAVVADGQKRGVTAGTDVQANGRRWAGMVGARITLESGQPRELVAFAMTEAAKARQARTGDTNTDTVTVADCTRQMAAELAMADAVNAPLPKPVKAQ